VNQATIPHKLPTLKSRHFILLAWMLLTAQLSSQLHLLEHLEHADHDEHGQEVCQLCILGADLGHGSIDTVVTSSAPLQTAWLSNVTCNNFTPALLTSYQGRAPPSLSSII
jgi:hypothetical protein